MIEIDLSSVDKPIIKVEGVEVQDICTSLNLSVDAKTLMPTVKLQLIAPTMSPIHVDRYQIIFDLSGTSLQVAKALNTAVRERLGLS
jgi:hypothetical protein